MRVARVPIVPAAILFDLWVGDASIRPDAAAGYAACEAASTALLQKTYEQSAASAGGGTGSDGNSSSGHTEPAKEDVLDAEFEEVKESDRKKA